MEILQDLVLPGSRDEATMMRYIKDASEWIDRELGNFIPITEAKRQDGEGGIDLYVPPLLAVTTLVDDANTLLITDYLLYPRSKLWENGPYIRITLDPDAATIGSWSNEADIIVINARWGMFELNRATGATVASQDISSTSLVVDTAVEISPGAVLLIESEQELVEGTGAATDSTADLAEDLDTSEEEIDVSDGTKVNTGEIIKVDFEQMKVLDKQTNTLLVERGWNGTKKNTHTTSTNVFVYRTFTVKRSCNGTTAAIHTTKAISRYFPPEDVNFLCRQMAALMFKKAQSGFAGKVGNPELGEVFYLQEFPKEAIEKVRKHYFVPLL